MTYLWGLEGREHAWAYSNGYFGARAPGTVRFWGAALLASFPPLAFFALLGLFRPGLLSDAFGVQIVGLLVLTTLMHGFSFSETRYHLPLIPLLAILAVRGLDAKQPLDFRRRAGVSTLLGLLVWGWLRHLPELLERYSVLTGANGWQTGLPF